MEALIAIGIWVTIFMVWYVRTYPERVAHLNPVAGIRLRRPSFKNKRKSSVSVSDKARKNYRALVEIVESISSREKFDTMDAATMVEAARQLMEIEPASAQIWEAFALDALETGDITCDQCHVAVTKTVKKTGVKIECKRCNRWLALKNSKVTIIDPHRFDLEDWER